MIEIQQGTPGSGKSAAAVARLLKHLRFGGVVAANFKLVDRWAETVAAQSWRARFNEDRHYSLASSLHSRFYHVDSVASIRKIDPKKEAVGSWASKEGKYQEGQGLLILDEAQLIFNARSWQKNMDWIEFFTQHRKLGWNVIMIAHDIQMIDAQIRPLCEYESRFRNLQKVKFPILGFPLSPFPAFLVIRRYAGISAGSGEIHSREVYPLPLWAARLYDSCAVFSIDQWGRDTEPRHCGEAPSPPSGGGAPLPPSPRRVSRLVGPHWDNYIQTLPS